MPAKNHIRTYIRTYLSNNQTTLRLHLTNDDKWSSRNHKIPFLPILLFLFPYSHIAPFVRLSHQFSIGPMSCNYRASTITSWLPNWAWGAGTDASYHKTRAFFSVLDTKLWAECIITVKFFAKILLKCTKNILLPNITKHLKLWKAS